MESGEDNTCNSPSYLLKRHKCSECEFRSIYRWVTKRHWEAKHRTGSTISGSSDNQNKSMPSAKIISSGQGSSITNGASDKPYDLRLIENFKIYSTGPRYSSLSPLMLCPLK